MLVSRLSGDARTYVMFFGPLPLPAKGALALDERRLRLLRNLDNGIHVALYEAGHAKNAIGKCSGS